MKTPEEIRRKIEEIRRKLEAKRTPLPLLFWKIFFFLLLGSSFLLSNFLVSALPYYIHVIFTAIFYATGSIAFYDLLVRLKTEKRDYRLQILDALEKALSLSGMRSGQEEILRTADMQKNKTRNPRGEAFSWVVSEDPMLVHERRAFKEDKRRRLYYTYSVVLWSIVALAYFIFDVVVPAAGLAKHMDSSWFFPFALLVCLTVVAAVVVPFRLGRRAFAVLFKHG